MTPHHWTVRADRRTADYDRVRDELLSLADTLVGLHLQLATRDAFFAAPDSGTFRDFVPIATAHADDVAVLEAMAEELLAELGYEVDVVPGS